MAEGAVKHAVVTGATGFIGSVLLERLKREGGGDSSVTGLGSKDVDLTDGGASFAWFKQQSLKHKVSHIFHLAAVYKAGGWPAAHPATQFYANMSINVNLLEAWARHCPKARLASVLSYCMYPPHDRPHPETELQGTEPEEYLYSYAMTKKSLLIGQRAYRQEYGMSCTAVILPTVYGPNDSFAEDSHVMGAMIGKFVRAARSGADTVEVWGDGLQEREFLYVDDAVDGLITAAAKSQADVLNLGAGRTHSIREIADLIAKASGFKGKIQYNPARFTGVLKRSLDSSRAARELGWTAQTSIETGIQKTVQWYERHLG